jgi:hypothetical protein
MKKPITDRAELRELNRVLLEGLRCLRQSRREAASNVREE